ncbi:MAG: hypothetical protein ABI480_02695 [Chitinophagaceae bacterium]
MSDNLVIDPQAGLHEFRNLEHQPKNPVVRILAKIISYVFHPLFVPVYIVWLLITLQPYLFSSFSPVQKMLKIIMFFVLYSFFPLVTVLLAKGLGFVESIYLKTQKDRIIPYIVSQIYYFWMCYVLRNQPENPVEIIQLSIAIFLASSAALIINIYMKISMHAIAMGILVTFTGMMAVTQGENYTVYLSVAILVAGLVCTSRLIVSDHTTKEIYAGLFLGACSQVVAIWVNGILP